MTTSIRLTKNHRIAILDNFLRAVQDQVAEHKDESTVEEQKWATFMSIRDWILGKHKDAFEALSKTDGILPFGSYVNVNFEEPPLADQRPEGKNGGSARVYRQTYFTIDIGKSVAMPYDMDRRSLSVGEMPKALQAKVKACIKSMSQYEVEMEALERTTRQLLNQCNTLKSLREKWPDADKYVPASILEGSKAVGITSAEIEAQVAKLMKAA